MQAITANDPETMGEFLDTLKSFGLTTEDPLIRSGMTFIMARQHADGSWGDRDDEDASATHARPIVDVPTATADCGDAPRPTASRRRR